MGGNFKEFAIARYHKEGILRCKITAGMRTWFYTEDSYYNYGGNIYKDYDENRPFDRGKSRAKVIKLLFIADIQGGYLVNPATNLKLLEVIFTEVLILQKYCNYIQSKY
jgi:hypothetical protein